MAEQESKNPYSSKSREEQEGLRRTRVERLKAKVEAFKRVILSSVDRTSKTRSLLADLKEVMSKANERKK